MREWYDSRTEILPLVKNLLSKCFVAGVDDIVYTYTEPVVPKIIQSPDGYEMHVKFQMFNIMLEYYGYDYVYYIHWFNDEVIIVHSNGTIQVHENRRTKPKLDEVYNYIVKQMRPR